MEDKNITPVTPNNWTNPSIGQSVDNSLREEVNELRNEVNELKEEISKLNVEEKQDTIETPKEEIVVEKEDVSVPFVESPFTEAINEETPKEEVQTSETQISNDMKDILDSVKEEVPVEEPTEEVPTFDDMLVEEDTEKLSVVVNRYNADIVATTKGKGAKFIALTEDEQSKLLSGKIN